MNAEQLVAIRKRAEKATEGPWQTADTTDGTLILGEDDWIIGGTFEVSADGVFCANAREDIPALLAEVERLQKRLLELGDCRCVLDYENVEDDGTFNEHSYEYFEEESE